MAEKESKFPTHKNHLNKTYLEELNYKFWSTKSIRFRSSTRLLTQNNLSNKAIGFLSAYLIILGLLSVYKITGESMISDNLIAFGTTTISILLLAFSQMEAAQDFKIRARNFQECALKVSALYDELRIFKTLQNSSEDDTHEFCKMISKKYQAVLEGYPNHESIDYKKFRVEQRDYFELGPWICFKTNLRYYAQVKLVYHAMILIPAIIIIASILNSLEKGL
ncbi:SLATT domain-containing protein [Reichenbachiella carrageenanivorans]|uniref:SLATT domain-containing protein n=1 Tax=Reichenbachiella carrageenanivorans TaxID=2979869 RepID=A0ABY6D2Y9_9BACT|nr:SLATT domain-containing protein [Reichenbachiella carrageenanivorans]UXX78200.1 SLATT domain-containing protein [Reichenbachiella carrageenanivorans]